MAEQRHQLSRRAVLKAVTAAVVGKEMFPSLSLAEASSAAVPGVGPSPRDDNLVLWYRQPANQWVEALPIGNGRIGGMIHGGVEAERAEL